MVGRMVGVGLGAAVKVTVGSSVFVGIGVSEGSAVFVGANVGVAAESLGKPQLVNSEKIIKRGYKRIRFKEIPNPSDDLNFTRKYNNNLVLQFPCLRHQIRQCI